MWGDLDIEIIKVLDNSEENSYIGIAHTNIIIYNSRRNLEQIRKIIAFIHEYNIEVLILPYMHPYGPILSEDFCEELDRKRFKNYALTTRTGYLHDLILIAKNYGINIFLPGYIENAGPRKYLSASLIYGYDGVIVRYRKMILNNFEKKIGLSHGTKLQFFKLDNISFSTMLDDELLYPEIARLNLFFTDFLVVGIPQNKPFKNYDSLIKTISKINKAVTIVPGGRIYRSSTLYYSLPTIIVNENGELLFKYNEDEQGIILIPINKVKRNKERSFNEIRRIYNLFKKYVRKPVIYVGD